ncbi:unnamed protein product [Urochloa decumbens]|uniref:Uncharacterized protein n=1 Tax=Urochloa decumbens TaxID=240449 RepID=A0ABC9FZI2_9POAL
MDYESICCYNSADVQALQARSNLFVDLVSLESVRVARETYALLGEMVALRSCLCTELDLLSLLAGVALELRKVKQDLFPRFMVQDANLDGAVLEALLLLKHSAIALLHLAEAIKERFEEQDESFDDVIRRLVYGVGVSLKDIADKVLNGGHKIVWLQARVTCLLGPINSLLATPVRFP